MENIFEGAKFGDRYITVSGKIAHFICRTEFPSDGHVLYCIYVDGENLPIWLGAAGVSGIRPEYNIVGEVQKSQEIVYDTGFDQECIELCKALNEMPGLETVESCCGHLKDQYMIWFKCDNFSTLARISRSIGKNYSDGLWELLMAGSDRYPCCEFWLRSKEPFQSYLEMSESVARLMENLGYWSRPEYNEYFKV